MPVSVKNFFERQATTSLRTDQPCDAGYVWTLIDNVAHMVDISGKYRINFLHDAQTAIDTGAYLINLSGNRPVISFMFPTDLVTSATYPCYDVRVAVSRFAEFGTSEDDTFAIRASIVTLETQPPVSVGPGVIGTLTGTTPTPAVGAYKTEWCIDGTITTGSITNAAVKQRLAPAITPDNYPGEQVWLKLLVEVEQPEDRWEYDDFTEWGWISGVQVREYPR